MSLRLYSIRLYLKVDRVWRRFHRLFFFWRKGRGADTFLERYRADHVLAISESERSLSPSFEHCQVCSLCTFSCEAVRKGDAPASFEPKLIPSVFAKYPHESEVFLEEWFPCARCAACTVLCPNEVPIHAMVQQVLDRRNRLGFRRGTAREKI